MNIKDVIDFCLTLPNTFEDRPFREEHEVIVMKHKENKKWYALIMKVQNQIYLNVKTEPEYSELLRDSFEYIIPAYHMNKRHWNTIIIGDVTLVKELSISTIS